MSGVDVAAGVTGLIVFSLKSLKTCLAGMDLISQARDFATYADRHRAQLEWQKHLLEEWHERVLPAENDVLSPQRNLNWTRIKDLLGQLELLLTDVEKLEDIYSFRIEPSENANMLSCCHHNQGLAHYSIRQGGDSSPILRPLQRDTPMSNPIFGQRLDLQCMTTPRSSGW